MTPDTFSRTLVIHVTPVTDEHPDDHPNLPGNTPFRLRTEGLVRYSRPEMELVDVPALYIEQAGKILNHWAFYTVNVKEVRVGETMADGFRGSVKLRATLHDGYLRLVPEEIGCMCGHVEELN